MKEPKTTKPEGAPGWFIPCTEYNWFNDSGGGSRIFVWYDKTRRDPFLSDNGIWYEDVRPMWYPEEGEPVAVWNNNFAYYEVRPFNKPMLKGKNSYNTMEYYANIAKYDGQRDMRVEALKDAPRI